MDKILELLNKGYEPVVSSGGMLYLSLNGSVFSGDPVSAGIGVGVSALGLFGASEAADAQAEAAEEAARIRSEGFMASGAKQEEFFERGLKLDEPFRNVQIQSLEEALRLAGVGAGQGLSPLGQIEQREGETAINRSLAARGIFGSGAGIEALTNFNEKLIASEAEKKFSRFTNIAGIQTPRLAGLSSQVGQNIGQTLSQAAQARAGGVQEAGQAEAGFFSGLGGFGAQTLSNIGNISQLGGGNLFSSFGSGSTPTPSGSGIVDPTRFIGRTGGPSLGF